MPPFLAFISVIIASVKQILLASLCPLVADTLLTMGEAGRLTTKDLQGGVKPLNIDQLMNIPNADPLCFS